ncbi:MAG: hypothetical protein R6U53_01185 [Natronomonas sp.]
MADTRADTIADGFATGSISERTLRTIAEDVNRIATVSDDQVTTGMMLLLERAK